MNKKKSQRDFPLALCRQALLTHGDFTLVKPVLVDLFLVLRKAVKKASMDTQSDLSISSGNSTTLAVLHEVVVGHLGIHPMWQHKKSDSSFAASMIRLQQRFADTLSTVSLNAWNSAKLFGELP